VAARRRRVSDHFATPLRRYLEGRRTSAPVLRPVPDIQDFDNFFRATVHNDVRRAYEFAGSFHLSGPAKAGESCQLFNVVNERLGDIPGSGGIVLLDVFNSSFKLVGGLTCPPNQPDEGNSRSMRLSTSWYSINSPRSACSMPFCTPAMKRA